MRVLVIGNLIAIAEAALSAPFFYTIHGNGAEK